MVESKGFWRNGIELKISLGHHLPFPDRPAIFSGSFSHRRRLLLCSLAIVSLFIDSALAVDESQSAMRSQASPQVAVIVRPSNWRNAAVQWMQYRQSQGVKILELDAELGASQLRESIINLAASENLKFVVLAGSTRAEGNIPTFHQQSTALVRLGGTELLASDNHFADLDGDGLPDLAVGRIPAQSAEQLSKYFQKTLDYEKNSDFTSWRRDVHAVAGVGGFGLLADSMIEMVSRQFLAEKLPGWINLSMTHANLTSHFCPDPECLTQTCLNRFNSGGLFWIYIGHGWMDRLDDFQLGQRRTPIMARSDLSSVNCSLPPIALFLACYTGAIDASEPSLAEELVMKPDGAIAAIAASRVSAPYGLTVLADGLLNGCFEHRHSTLGEIFLSAKQSMMDEGQFQVREGPTGQLASIHAMAKLMSPKGYDLRAERMEHVWQMNLLGDPLLRINHPELLEVELPDAQWSAGQSVKIIGRINVPGTLTIELTRQRGQGTGRLKPSEINWTSQEGRATYDRRYQQANQLVLAEATHDLGSGEFTAEFLLPDHLDAGIYGLRFYLQSDTGWQTAYHQLKAIAHER